jgi:hypothetical protein
MINLIKRKIKMIKNKLKKQRKIFNKKIIGINLKYNKKKNQKYVFNKNNNNKKNSTTNNRGIFYFLIS